MQGLRTQETNKFKKFFSIVQDAAKKNGCVFYLDAGDGRDFETDSLEGEDLMGWLIPERMAEEFEPIWKRGLVSDDWSEYFGFAIWENQNSPTIKFNI
ncbi:MAG: hypothetical protein E7638_05670 [Ruminococcaceae bacterium]|nr:hypothetical protein [Oscillospiraceae bacterium]